MLFLSSSCPDALDLHWGSGDLVWVWTSRSEPTVWTRTVSVRRLYCIHYWGFNEKKACEVRAVMDGCCEAGRGVAGYLVTVWSDSSSAGSDVRPSLYFRVLLTRSPPTRHTQQLHPSPRASHWRSIDLSASVCTSSYQEFIMCSDVLDFQNKGRWQTLRLLDC